jgi:methyl-accepting chemotaxis protein
MHFFRNLSLRARLGLAFGIVCALLAAVTVVGITGSQSQEGTSDEVAHLLSLTTDVQELRYYGTDISGWQIAYAWDIRRLGPDQARDDAPSRKGFLESRAGVEKELEGFHTGYMTASERAGLDRIEKNFVRFFELDAEAFELYRQGGEANLAKADELVGGEGFEIYYAVVDDTAKLIDSVKGRAHAAVEDANSQAAAARTLSLAVAAVALIAALLLGWLIVRSITRPVARLSERLRSLDEHCLPALADGLQAVAAGDLTRPAAAITEPIEDPSKDEIGRLTTVFNSMLGTAQSGIDSYNDMRTELAKMIGEIDGASTHLGSASQQMASTSEEAGKAVGEIAGSVGEVAAGTERQVRAIVAVRALTDEMASAARESASEAHETASAAEQAREVATAGVQAVTDATDAMRAVREASAEASSAIRELGVKSDRISGIVATITGIAGQTNLLALNAAIEAARAGEQGRGFAVVAEEVRKLAEESQQAAEQISGLIEEIQSETGRAVDVVQSGAERTHHGAETVEQARESFEAIGSRVDDVTARVERIATSVAEIADRSGAVQRELADVAAVAEQSSASTEEVSATTEQTSASTQEIAASAQELATTAQQLDQLVGRFTVQSAAD